MRRHGENGHSMRKFKVLAEQIIRPGYSNESQFACRHCGKRYRWKSTMRRHEQVECGGKEPMFQCPECPYRAKQKGNLGVHVRKHHPLLMQIHAEFAVAAATAAAARSPPQKSDAKAE